MGKLESSNKSSKLFSSEHYLACRRQTEFYATMIAQGYDKAQVGKAKMQLASVPKDEVEKALECIPLAPE